MTTACLILIVHAAAAYTPSAAPRVPRAALRARAVASTRDLEECIVDAESAEERLACVDAESAQETMFTLEAMGDGWDDVRRYIVDAKKDRAKAWDEVNTLYVRPTAKWTKVLADEFVPSIKGAAEILPNADEAKAQGGGLKGAALAALDNAGKRRQAERAAAAPSAPPQSGASRSEADEKSGGGKNVAIAGANIAFVLGTLLAAPVLAVLIGLGDI